MSSFGAISLELSTWIVPLVKRQVNRYREIFGLTWLYEIYREKKVKLIFESENEICQNFNTYDVKLQFFLFYMIQILFFYFNGFLLPF